MKDSSKLLRVPASTCTDQSNPSGANSADAQDDSSEHTASRSGSFDHQYNFPLGLFGSVHALFLCAD